MADKVKVRFKNPDKVEARGRVEARGPVRVPVRAQVKALVRAKVAAARETGMAAVAATTM